MPFSFPKRNCNNLKGAIGQAYFQYFVNKELECIYHPINQENDFGVDGYIEIVESGNVTGKTIGVQLKHGDSFFKTKTGKGYRFVGENKHLNYYQNNPSPIFIIVMDTEFKRMYWEKFDIVKTLPVGDKSWWIEIDEENLLDKNFKDAIFEAAGPIINFEEQIKRNWLTHSLIQTLNHNVPEIAQFDKSIQMLSGGRTSVIMIIDSDQDSKIEYKEYYTIHVSENHSTHTVRWNTFYVHKDFKKLMVYDVITGETVTLEMWRDLKKKRGY